ncbi:MAG: GNAT family N-acetyltransferase [Shimia sp.]
MGVIRRASIADAAACASILNDWIDATEWMPRCHPHDDVERHYREDVLPEREMWVNQEPTVVGFAAVSSDGFVTALYVARPGEGLGTRLLDQAKAGRDALSLWTFVANTGAQRFYQREGFQEVRRTEGANEEGLPDILYRWERAA